MDDSFYLTELTKPHDHDSDYHQIEEAQKDKEVPGHEEESEVLEDGSHSNLLVYDVCA